MPNLVHVLVSSIGGCRAGLIITNAGDLSRLQRIGAVTLPVDDDLVLPTPPSALDGYFIKKFGNGWVADKGSGERCCPMVLRVLANRNNVHWVARVMPAAGKAGTDVTGRLRLVTDTTQAAFINAGLSQQEIPDLVDSTPMDQAGGWTLRGRSLISVTTDGVLAVALHAVARNMRIIWSAVSLSSAS
jgi:hypothetical protein